MNDIILYAVLGLGTGTAYVLLGLGTVAIHRGSGVVNFAQGAIAMVSAVVMVKLLSAGAPMPVAIIVALLVSGILGALIYLLIMRPLASAPALARNVATLGVMVVLLAGVPLFFGSVNSLTVPPFLPSSGIDLFGARFGQDRLWLLAIACIATALLTIVYRATRFGLATRAVSENELGASLLGYSPSVIACSNWVLGSVLAGFAGVIVAPISGINPVSLTFLVVPALAAALVGGFSSFGLTLAAGIGLGIAQSEAQLIPGGISGIGDAIPFILVIIAMMLRSKATLGRDTLGQGRPPSALAGRIKWWYIAIPAVAIVAGSPFIDPQYLFAVQTTFAFGVIFLSQTIVTGYAGQISLAQLTFAGLGVLFTSNLAFNLGLPFPIPILLAGLAALPFGAIVGLPAVRVRGVNLAVLTLALSAAAYTFVFGQQAWTGGPGISPMPPASFFGLDLDAVVYPQRYLIVTFIFLVLAAIVTSMIRRSSVGRRFLAVRENERAASASGVNVVRTKLVAFSIAASMAAVGGSLLAYQSTAVTYDQFQASGSVTLLSASYIFGVGSVFGAILAGITSPGGLLSTVLASSFGTSVTEWIPLIMGVLLILTVVTNPDGAVPFVRNAIAARRARRVRRAAHVVQATGVESGRQGENEVTADADFAKAGR